MTLRSHEIRLQKETKNLKEKKKDKKRRACSHGDGTMKKSGRERRRCVVVGEGRRETQGEFRNRWVWNCGVLVLNFSYYYYCRCNYLGVGGGGTGGTAAGQGADRGRAKWSHAPPIVLRPCRASASRYRSRTHLYKLKKRMLFFF